MFKGKLKHGKWRDALKELLHGNQRSEPILHRCVISQDKQNPCYFISILLFQHLEIEREIDSFLPPTSLQVKKSDYYKYIQTRHVICSLKNSVRSHGLPLLLNIQILNSLPLIYWWLPYTHTQCLAHRGTQSTLVELTWNIEKVRQSEFERENITFQLLIFPVPIKKIGKIHKTYVLFNKQFKSSTLCMYQ